MGTPLRRVAVLALPFVLVAIVAVLAIRSTSDPGYYASVTEVVGDTSRLGDEVFVGGMVVACDGRSLILRPEDSDSPTLSVVLADGEPDILVGKRVMAVARGILSEPDVITEARVITKGPSSYATASIRN